MILLATTASQSGQVLMHLHDVPADFWMKAGIGLIVLIVGIVLLQKLAEVNKVVVAVVALMAFSTIGLTWVYERTEPTWATPAVNFLAGFLPSKGAVANHPPVASAPQKKS